MLQLRFTNNTKPPMWLVAPKYTFGTNHDCDCVLTQPGVEPLHAEISAAGEAVSIIRVSDSGLLTVNGAVVEVECQLKPGDKVSIGETQLQVVDPKLEGPKKAAMQNADKTHIRPVLAAGAQREPEVLWQLRPLNTTLAQSESISLKGSMLLGRSKECDICIPATHLSRKHAKFSVLGQGLTVEDLGSSNGTFVNGARIERITLKYGDEVGFDTLKFRVEGTGQIENDVTSLRPALDETQIRQAVTSDQIQRQASPAARRAPPVRPKAASPVQSQANSGDTIKLLAGAAIVVGVVAFLAWFLLT